MKSSTEPKPQTLSKPSGRPSIYAPQYVFFNPFDEKSTSELMIIKGTEPIQPRDFDALAWAIYENNRKIHKFLLTLPGQKPRLEYAIRLWEHTLEVMTSIHQCELSDPDHVAKKMMVKDESGYSPTYFVDLRIFLRRTGSMPHGHNKYQKRVSCSWAEKREFIQTGSYELLESIEKGLSCAKKELSQLKDTSEHKTEHRHRSHCPLA